MHTDSGYVPADSGYVPAGAQRKLLADSKNLLI